jgi:hypothetical protein
MMFSKKVGFISKDGKNNKNEENVDGALAGLLLLHLAAQSLK